MVVEGVRLLVPLPGEERQPSAPTSKSVRRGLSRGPRQPVPLHLDSGRPPLVPYSLWSRLLKTLYGRSYR